MYKVNIQLKSSILEILWQNHDNMVQVTELTINEKN